MPANGGHGGPSGHTTVALRTAVIWRELDIAQYSPGVPRMERTGRKLPDRFVVAIAEKPPFPFRPTPVKDALVYHKGFHGVRCI